jgi:hypothetical protein
MDHKEKTEYYRTKLQEIVSFSPSSNLVSSSESLSTLWMYWVVLHCSSLTERHSHLCTACIWQLREFASDVMFAMFIESCFDNKLAEVTERAAADKWEVCWLWPSTVSFEPVCQLYLCFDVWLAVSPMWGLAIEGCNWTRYTRLRKLLRSSIGKIGNLCEEHLISIWFDFSCSH